MGTAWPQARPPRLRGEAQTWPSDRPWMVSKQRSSGFQSCSATPSPGDLSPVSEPCSLHLLNGVTSAFHSLSREAWLCPGSQSEGGGTALSPPPSWQVSWAWLRCSRPHSLGQLAGAQWAEATSS